MTKMITFGIMHFTIAFTLAYLITGSVMVGGLLAILEPMVNTLGYGIHVRIWNRIESKQ